MNSKIVLASNNTGKLDEIQTLLGDEIELLTMADFNLASPAETELTFVENALLKARYVADKTKLPALADDSGLCVPALDGAPGLYSSRYAGEPVDHQKNIQKLLQAMQGLIGEQRQAYFYCVLVLLQNANDPAPLIAEGHWHGRILDASVGEGGFGYDSVFGVEAKQCSAAQLNAEDKNRLSHRGQALQALKGKMALQTV